METKNCFFSRICSLYNIFLKNGWNKKLIRTFMIHLYIFFHNNIIKDITEKPKIEKIQPKSATLVFLLETDIPLLFTFCCCIVYI